MVAMLLAFPAREATMAAVSAAKDNPFSPTGSIFSKTDKPYRDSPFRPASFPFAGFRVDSIHMLRYRAAPRSRASIVSKKAATKIPFRCWQISTQCTLGDVLVLHPSNSGWWSAYHRSIPTGPANPYNWDSTDQRSYEMIFSMWWSSIQIHSKHLQIQTLWPMRFKAR